MPVRNLPHEKTRASIANNLTSETCRWFVRLHTNKRVSYWFGEREGSRTTFEAPSGFCINAFRGKTGRHGCSQLGVVYAPIGMASEGHSTVYSFGTVNSLDVAGSSSKYEHRTWGDAPRAIVVKMDDTMGRVRVVSAAEVDRVTRFGEPFAHDPKEHGIALSDDEQTESVRITVSEKRVVRFRVTTDMQTTTTFGREETSETTTLSRNVYGKASICGFAYGASEGNGRADMEFLRVLYAPLGAKRHAPSKAASSPVVASRTRSLSLF